MGESDIDRLRATTGDVDIPIHVMPDGDTAGSRGAGGAGGAGGTTGARALGSVTAAG